MAVSVVLTACNRPDLLERTLETFMKFNTYPIDSWIISEDGGDPSVNKTLMDKYPHFTWIHGKRGQIKSIDEAYSLVKTPYILHWEEDWETYEGGFIEESLKILESTPTVSAVMIRKYGDGAYIPSNTPPFLNCIDGWGYYSFNPGLRRTSDIREWFPNGFSEFAKFDSEIAHSAEIIINNFVKSKGYRLALTPKWEGFISHIGWDRHVMNLRIGLCMIVKNEAHIIHESMECTLPLIDTYCIVDTGSTDDTISKIKEFYDSRGIRGEVHERPWVDFGTNRSQALKLCDGKMDYILVIDADDLMTFPKNGKEILLEKMKSYPSNFVLDMRQGTLRYSRSQIFKANDGWHYKGVLHEYPTNGKKSQEIRLPSEFWMESRRIGGRNKTGDKLLRDIEVLEKGVKDEPNNERYMFYLAQSYRDNNNIPKAIEWYTKRFEFGGWYEETYIAGVNIAQMSNSKEWAWKAHTINPKRIECLVSYMQYCRSTNKWSQELYAMAKYATSIPKPTDQVLFLDTEVYDWKVWDEFSIIAYYTGHRDEAYAASKKLLNNPSVPESQRARILANSVFGEPADSIIPVRRHDTGDYWGGIHSNCAYNGDIIKFVREAERKLDSRLSIFIEDSDGIVDTVAYSALSDMSKTHVRLESNIKFEPKPHTKQVIAVLASRNVFRRDLLFLPFDDEIFKNGLSLGNIPAWKDRRSKAVWRGKENGSETRVEMVKILESYKLADVKFAKYDRTNFLDCIQQANYKYILSIDGTCIASSHQWVFGSGAVPIIITHPGNNFWFKSHLKDRENCMFVKYDLSNLRQTIEWLVDHDSESEMIAKNAFELSKRIFTPEFQREYIEKELRSIV